MALGIPPPRRLFFCWCCPQAQYCTPPAALGYAVFAGVAFHSGFEGMQPHSLPIQIGTALRRVPCASLFCPRFVPGFHAPAVSFLVRPGSGFLFRVGAFSAGFRFDLN